MALWSHGKSPDTTSTEYHARAHRLAAEREKAALKICKGCKHLSKVQFNLMDLYVCDGLTSYNPSNRAIASILQEKKCIMGKKGGNEK